MMQIKKIHPNLPIFWVSEGDRSLVYSPGHVVAVSHVEAEKLATDFDGSREQPMPALSELASQLCAASTGVVRQWQATVTSPFEPECLTVYLSNHCNLRCVYCFASQADGARVDKTFSPGKLPLIEDQTVQVAAHSVAKTCQKKSKRFTLVLHGGGEPTMHWELLQDIVASTRRIANDYEIEWWGYIATHGVISETKAAWLAGNFNLIGLSCDGPPDIHNWQRPMRNGRTTFAAVKRTAQLFVKKEIPFTIRATITPDVVHRQNELVAFFCNEFKAKDIRFEPVYLPKNTKQRGFQKEDAPDFVNHFVQAQKAAHSFGANLSLSGVRIDEIHGPYCNLLRNVLQLTPDGAATACFLTTDSRNDTGQIMKIGEVNSRPGQRFEITLRRITQIRRKITNIPKRCEDCVNFYHCARDCPDVCPVNMAETEQGGFRCQVHKLLTNAWLDDLLHSSRWREDSDELMINEHLIKGG